MLTLHDEEVRTVPAGKHKVVTALAAQTNCRCKAYLSKLTERVGCFRRVLPAKNVVLWLTAGGILEFLGAVGLPFTPVKFRNPLLSYRPDGVTLKSRVLQMPQELQCDDDEHARLSNRRHKRTGTLKLKVTRLGARGHAMGEHLAVVAPWQLGAPQSVDARFAHVLLGPIRRETVVRLPELYLHDRKSLTLGVLEDGPSDVLRRRIDVHD